ncbi:MAG: SMI1/KNR4 family protein [Pseudomonadota bacterium]
MIRLSNGFDDIDMEAIKKFEQKWNFKFPDSYKAFLLESNGGKPALDRFSFFDINKNGLDQSVINNFYGVPGKKNTKKDYLNLNFKLAIFSERLPKDFIPIASDVFGNQVVLALSGENEGCVYFFDHELEEDNLSMIAKTLDEFLSSLQSPLYADHEVPE